MADPDLKPIELKFLDFLISKAQESLAEGDWQAAACAAHDVMQVVPLRMAGDTYESKIAEKVRKALAEALRTPGITIADLIHIRKVVRTL